MLKTLLKKQFLELNTFYFQNKKTGKNRSKGGTIGMIILFTALFASIGVAFFGMDSLLCSAFIPLDMGWMYFAMTGILALFLGVFGGVFNTYAGLYHAKDNEMLLAMPIQPSKILFARMVGVYAMGLLYESLAIVPAVIAYWLYAEINALRIILPVILIFVLGFLVLALVCALGWVVAIISSKLKNKSFITVIASLVFLGLYYVVYFRMNTILQNIAANAQEIGEKARGVYPLYVFGLAWDGNVLPMLAVTVIVFAVAALAYYVMSKTFVKIVTTKAAEKKSVYKSEKAKNTGVKGALLRKELKRFTASPTYMMNGGLGLIIMPALAVAALIKRDIISATIGEIFQQAGNVVLVMPAAVTALVCLVLSMNQITTPSVSLEGKNIWVLQSMPVDTWEILKAKQKLHIMLNAPVAVISSVILGIAFEFNPIIILVMMLFSLVSVVFTAAFGLLLNLLKPNLTWTNEVVPIKQGISVMIGLFGSWFIYIAFGGIGFLTRSFIQPIYYITIGAVILAGVTVLLNRWLKKKGTVIFENL